MNKDTDKTKEQLIAELEELRDRSKKGEKALKESEDRFTTVANASPDGIGISDLNGIIEFVSPKTIAMWGYSKEEFIGKHIHEVIHEKSHGTVDHVIDELLKGNNLGALEYEMVRKDGTIFICEANCSLLYDKNNNPEKVLYIQRDITERKQAEELLRESDLRLKTLINATPDLICFKDGQGRWLIANDADLELFALKNVDYFGKTDADLAEFTDPIYKQAFLLCMESDEKSWQSNVLSRGEEVIPTIDGTNKTFDVIKVPLFESDGTRKGLVVLGRDITDRKQAEEKLKEKERFLQTIFDGIQEPMHVIDRDFRVVLTNKRLLEMKNLKQEDICGEYCYKAYQGRNEFCEQCGAREVFQTGKPCSLIKFLPMPDGTYRYFEVFSFPLLEENGEVTQVIELTYDITAQKQAEQKLQDERIKLFVTLQSIGDGVITTDTDGRVTFINCVAEQLTGWNQAAAAGEPLSEVFPIINEKTGLTCENPVNKVLDSGTIIGLENHTTLIAKDGTQRSIADSAAPISDSEGKIIGVVLVFRDVTQEKKREEEVLKIKKLESVGVLAGGIAHDFNNILAAILGNISLADMKIEKGHKSHRLLKEAEKASLRARDLTQQLLTFSKGGDPIRETASITQVITDSADFVLHGSNVKCRYAIPKDLWLVDIDTGQMSQVIQNITINARHAMPEGGEIKISCENIADITTEPALSLPEEKYIKITIADTGSGIPEKYLDKIFDPYFSTKQQGSGLGLAITHSIIHKHDGHISVRSKSGEGTTFTLYLPASAEQESRDVKEEAQQPGKTVQGTILVMDDEQMIRDIAKQMLSDFGHDVLQAKDGEEAIALFKEHYHSDNPVDVIIMDLTIPGGMGGKEVIKEILKIDPAAKAIVSSGYSNDPVMANYQQYGFKAAIGKPFEMAKLEETVTSVLG